jgi:hypothetical protein
VNLDLLLPLCLVILPFINWPVAFYLVRASRRDPRILSLRERAGYAILIATLTTVYVGVTINSELGYPVFDIYDGRAIVRFGVLIIGLYPLWWLWSYLTNRFR